jgi:hypothetical protein
MDTWGSPIKAYPSARGSCEGTTADDPPAGRGDKGFERTIGQNCQFADRIIYLQS